MMSSEITRIFLAICLRARGVPQGSTLWLFLFPLYISDVLDDIDSQNADIIKSSGCLFFKLHRPRLTL